MRTLLHIACLVAIVACSDPDAPDCLRTSGEITSASFQIEGFEELEINDEFVVILEQGNEQRITITAGENLIDNIRYELTDNRLTLFDDNGCNWVREFQFPEVRISTPHLHHIRQNGGGVVRSAGTLKIDELVLVSEDRTGDFELALEGGLVQIINNDLSNYRLSGTVDQLVVGFFSGDGRFDGSALLAKEVKVFQRGTNDMIVQATETLTGRIISQGNVVYTKTIPPVIDVSLEGKGKLIYKE